MKINPQQTVITFDRLQVNSIESASAIFFGATNMAHGWSSHSKQNSGFGKLSDSRADRNLNVVFDDDVIDSPINDADQFVIAGPRKESELKLALSDINVNAIDTNSAVSVGSVSQNGWSAHSKSNAGGLHHKGITFSTNERANIMDNDLLDAPMDFGNVTIEGKS